MKIIAVVVLAYIIIAVICAVVLFATGVKVGAGESDNVQMMLVALFIGFLFPIVIPLAFIIWLMEIVAKGVSK